MKFNNRMKTKKLHIHFSIENFPSWVNFYLWHFALQSSFVGAIAVGDLIKSTLGPKGMDKILQGAGKNDTLQVTNDGATILRAIGVDNPAAKVLVGM